MTKHSAITIKSITTPRYQVSLVQLENGSYRLATQVKPATEPTISEPTFDYHMASFLFDNKVEELEGH